MYQTRCILPYLQMLDELLHMVAYSLKVRKIDAVLACNGIFDQITDSVLK